SFLVNLVPRSGVRDEARFSAHRFFSAATIAALPAALSFRLGLVAGAAGTEAPLAAAHLLRCASAIRFRPAGLIVERLVDWGAAAAVGCRPLSMARSSLICASIRRFWPSKPSMAAVMISGFSVARMLILLSDLKAILCHTRADLAYDSPQK